MGKRTKLESTSETEQKKTKLDDSALDTSAIPDAPPTDKEEYEALFGEMNAIAQPVAPRKLAKKLYKLLRKSAKTKKRLLRGTAEIQRGFRKGVKGIVIMAGNVSPIDIYSHVPALCEEQVSLPGLFASSPSPPPQFFSAIALDLLLIPLNWDAVSQEVEYVFTPSKEHLGLACGHKRANVILMVLPDPSYQELYDDCKGAMKTLA